MGKIVLNNIEAINHALDLALSSDKSTVIYGEDVGLEGGVFRATQKLQKKYGELRVFDSPISEAAIIGTGVGAAMGGLKPIVEIQFSGFAFLGFQQLIVLCSRMRNKSRGRYTVPLVVRMPMGGGVRALESHSEAIESMLAHVPGLKVVIPSNPYDSKGLLLSAINDSDPVVFLEPKKLYRAFKQEIPEEYYQIELGKANIIKEGKDLTVVTYGAQVIDVIEAQKKLNNISLEIIDLRTIKPLDENTIIKSVKKTNRVLIVHEAVKSFSVSSEIISIINEKAFSYLKSKPRRLTGWDIIVPYAKGERFHSISVERIIDAAKKCIK